jgi:hypothetical protein
MFFYLLVKLYSIRKFTFLIKAGGIIMSFSFDVTIDDVRSGLQQAKSSGISVSGDETSGKFRGYGVHGSYTANGNKIRLRVDGKPFLFSESMIKNAVRSAIR